MEKHDSPSDEGDPSERSKLDDTVTAPDAPTTTTVSVTAAPPGAEAPGLGPPAPSSEEPNVEVSLQLKHYGSDDTPQVATFEDHFTLSVPSSVIRYRDRKAAARVIDEIEIPSSVIVWEPDLSDRDDAEDVTYRVTVSGVGLPAEATTGDQEPGAEARADLVFSYDVTLIAEP